MTHCETTILGLQPLLLYFPAPFLQADHQQHHTQVLLTFLGQHTQFSPEPVPLRHHLSYFLLVYELPFLPQWLPEPKVCAFFQSLCTASFSVNYSLSTQTDNQFLCVLVLSPWSRVSHCTSASFRGLDGKRSITGKGMFTRCSHTTCTQTPNFRMSQDGSLNSNSTLYQHV